MTAPTPWPKRIWVPAACALAAWLVALAADDRAHPVVAAPPNASDGVVVAASESAPRPAAEPTEPARVEPEPPRDPPPSVTVAPAEPLVAPPEAPSDETNDDTVDEPIDEPADEPVVEPVVDAPAAVPAAPIAAAAPAPIDAPLEPSATATAASPVPHGYSAWNAVRELPAAVAALEAEFTTRLGPAQDDYVWSGDALLPWVVIAPRDTVPEFATLHRARQQLDVELLGPLDRRLSAATPVVVGWLDAVRFAALSGSMREMRGFAVTESDGAAALRVTGRTIEALTVATLAQLLGESAPRWWVDGAAAWLAADPATTLLAALAPDVSLAPLFRNDPGAPPAAGVAGAFTAWCLDPSGGGAHVRASWFETPRLRGAVEQPDELAARFGCAHFAELEQRWRSARSR